MQPLGFFQRDRFRAAALGAAILAGTAVGEYRDCADGVDATVAVGCEFLPRSEENRIYKEKFEEYRKLYAALKDFNHNLN